MQDKVQMRVSAAVRERPQDELGRLLQSWVVPVPAAEFGAAVWRRIRSGEEDVPIRVSTGFRWRPLWTAVAAAVALVAGVWVGMPHMQHATEPSPLLAEWTLAGSYAQLLSGGVP